MNIASAIRRHEDLAAYFARVGKAKKAASELRRVDQLKKLRELKRKNPTYRMFDDAVNADNFEDSREVYQDATV